MAADDGAMRERLVEDGSLFDGYNPLMAIVHRRNGDRLVEVLRGAGRRARGEDVGTVRASRVARRPF